MSEQETSITKHPGITMVPEPVETDMLLAAAAVADKRVQALVKIKQASLAVTNANDWTAIDDKPWLNGSGAEKIANVFGISWRFSPDSPRKELRGDKYLYMVRAEFTMGLRSIEVEGSCQSDDPFVASRWQNGEKVTLPSDQVDEANIMKAALTNAIILGVTRILGLRNMTWEDLARGGVLQANVKGYKHKGGGVPTTGATGDGSTVTGPVNGVTMRTGTAKSGKSWTLYTLDACGDKFTTFDTKLAEAAKALAGQYATVTFKPTDKGKDLVGVEPADPPSDAPREPGEEG